MKLIALLMLVSCAKIPKYEVGDKVIFNPPYKYRELCSGQAKIIAIRVGLLSITYVVIPPANETNTYVYTTRCPKKLYIDEDGLTLQFTIINERFFHDQY